MRRARMLASEVTRIALPSGKPGVVVFSGLSVDDENMAVWQTLRDAPQRVDVALDGDDGVCSLEAATSEVDFCHHPERDRIELNLRVPLGDPELRGLRVLQNALAKDSGPTAVSLVVSPSQLVITDVEEGESDGEPDAEGV